jgi:type IV pilus assembly protein PilM
MNWGWKRSFRLEVTETKETFGLDISSSAVKMVQMRKDDDGYKATAAGIVDIVDASPEIDENSRQINTTSGIHRCYQSTGIHTRMAVCGVSGPEVAVRDFKFPSLPQREVEGAIMLEASQVCPFNIRDGVVDYQLIPQDEKNLSGVLVAATNKLINNKVRLAKNASLNCVMMDADGLALLNCFHEYDSQNRVDENSGEGEDQGNRTAAILNVGSSVTILAVTSDNALPFIRDIAYGGDDIVKKIAIEKNITTNEARKVLAGDPEVSELDLGASLKKACERLIVDVTETLRYYAVKKKSSVVEKIYVCGDLALVNGFVKLLDSWLPAEVVLWNPFDGIRSDAGWRCKDILLKKGPALAVAAGLAMRLI